jgi:hypothetical protein
LSEEIAKEITKHIEDNRRNRRDVNNETKQNEYLITTKYLDALYLSYFN